MRKKTVDIELEEQVNEEVVTEVELTPTVIEPATAHADSEADVELQKGQIYITANFPDGSEKPGSGFITTANMWDKTYGKQTFNGLHPKFNLKKKYQ